MKHSSICFAILVLAGIAAALPVPSSQLPPWQLPDDWVLANPKEGYNLYGRKLYTGKEILTFMTQDEALDIFQEGLRRAREKMKTSNVPEYQRDSKFFGDLWDEVMDEMKISKSTRLDIQDALDDLSPGERELSGIKRDMQLNGIARHLPAVAPSLAELNRYEDLLLAKQGELAGLTTVSCTLQPPVRQCAQEAHKLTERVRYLERQIRALTTSEAGASAKELEKLNEALVIKKSELEAVEQGRCRQQAALDGCQAQKAKLQREISRLQTLITNTKKKWEAEGGPPPPSQKKTRKNSRKQSGSQSNFQSVTNNQDFTSTPTSPPVSTTQKKNTPFAGVQWPARLTNQLNTLITGTTSRSMAAGGRIMGTAAIL